MIFKIPDILREVRVSLDENGVSDELLRTGDVETLSLDDIIRQKVPEAVRLVHTAARLISWRAAITSGTQCIGEILRVAGCCCRMTSCAC